MLGKTRSLILLALFLVIVPTVNAQITNLSLDISNTSLNLLQNDFTIFNINITNSDPTENITISFTYDPIVDDDNDEVTIIFPSDFTILANSSNLLTISVDVDNNMDSGAYSSIFTFTKLNSTENTTFSFSTTISPGFCDFGQVGTDLQLGIEDPDSGEDYSPGDTIKIEVEVENVGTDDIDVQVEAFLYNEDDIIESVSSNTENIEDGEDETFHLSLEIPTDNGDIDEDEDYTIYVKAYDDDDEDENCIQDSVDIEIELETHKVILEESTRFIESSISCGEEISVIANVKNLGEKDEDVMIVVENKQLGIYETSDTFELEEFDSNEDNEATRTFNILIPEGISEEIYDFFVKAVYSGKSASMSLPLEVWSCESTAPQSTSFEYVSLYIKSEKILSLESDKASTIHLVIQNDAAESKILFLSLSEVSDFSESASKTFTVEPYQSTNIFLPLNINSNVEEGTYTAIVELSDGSSILASDTITINIGDAEEASESPGYLSLGLSKTNLVILNLLMIIILLVFIVLLKHI
tara:strand:+ start:4240 stop:5820 length:1581 start_codon:yes stop_codon:yes gene_type:complete